MFSPMILQILFISNFLVTIVMWTHLSILKYKRLWTDQISSDCKSSCMRVTSDLSSIWRYNFALSANRYIFDTILSGIVLMYIKNSTGPSTELWGIPLFTGCHEDLESLNTTLCCRPERKSVIQFKVLPVTPYCLRTPISLLCGTESKAFLKFKYIMSTFSCLSIALVKSAIIFRSCKFRSLVSYSAQKCSFFQQQNGYSSRAKKTTRSSTRNTWSCTRVLKWSWSVCDW